ncbi:hypothetical protein [Nocardia inohanensis]|uniref:hypothetical protein n=1 Tax=Nocardia inohanensis TaxID=209246 RepID=UPI000834C1C9|nr:hypothetical protein [Nocardia inohanensis]
MNEPRERRWTRLIPAGYSLILALLVLGPLLSPGYLLLRDAVSTPRSYLTDSALGLGDAAPRAVPQDALIATLSTVIDGGLLVKAILLAAIWLAGWGAARLARELLDVTLAPQLAAATVAIWNPYVAERLLQGHWSLLTGYAALPWIALLANRLRRPRRAIESAIDEQSTNDVNATVTGSKKPQQDCGPAEGTARRGEQDAAAAVRGADDQAGAQHISAQRDWWMWAALGGLLAAAGLTPTGSLLAGCVLALLVGRRNLVGALALWVLTSAPWLAATALAGSAAQTSDPAGVAAFAARAEPWLGTVGSLAGLGGIWNSTAVPGSRTTFFAAIGTLLLLAVVATGVRAVMGTAGSHPRVFQPAEPGDTLAASGIATGPSDSGVVLRNSSGTDHRPAADPNPHARRMLLGLALIAVVIPALGATGWGLAAGEFLVTKVPGAGLFRDTQKFVALAIPGYALCAAAGCRVVGEWISARQARAAGLSGTEARSGGSSRTAGVAAGFVVLLAIALPDLAWGVGGALRPVQYPAGWARVAEIVDAPGDVAVLPGGMFRKFRYSGKAPVLDPAPRMLRRDVLQTGELPVAGGSVAGEGTRAREAEQVLLHGGSAARLGELGVGWVLMEGGTPGPVGESKTTLDQLIPVYADRELRLYRVPGAIADHDASAADRRISGAAHLLWAALLISGMLAAAWHSRDTRISRAGNPGRTRSR